LITLISDGKYDPLYLRNYANIRVKDQLARIPGVGQITAVRCGDLRCASCSIDKVLRAA